MESCGLLMNKRILVLIEYVGFQFLSFITLDAFLSWMLWDMDRTSDAPAWQISIWIRRTPILLYLKASATFTLLFALVLIGIHFLRKPYHPSFRSIAFVAALSAIFPFLFYFLRLVSQNTPSLALVSHCAAWVSYFAPQVIWANLKKRSS